MMTGTMTAMAGPGPMTSLPPWAGAPAAAAWRQRAGALAYPARLR